MTNIFVKGGCKDYLAANLAVLPTFLLPPASISVGRYQQSGR
jgi:hypothetical protein